VKIMLGRYSIPQFIKDAKAILATDEALEQKKAAIAEHLLELAKRDDLSRFGTSLGPSDASSHSYLLWREQPYTVLTLAQFDPHYLSPVHDHGDFWVVVAGYRGIDRWDMYERQDDGSRPGFADLKMVDQIYVPPGKAVWMPPPPRAIHSHNNLSASTNLELIFTAAMPQPPEKRLIFDVEGHRCWPSPWDMTKRRGENYPPVPMQSTIARTAKDFVHRLRHVGCPICMALA